MAEQPQRIVEKHYIEVSASAKTKFINGLIGGIGWGIGLSLGTAVILYLGGQLISRIDFVPIFGSFLADIIKSAQGNINTR